MLIKPEEQNAFLHFIKLNSALWLIEDSDLGPAPSDATIFIDLLSHDVHQVIRALYVGKILQRKLQGRIVGVVGNLLFSRDLDFRYEKSEAIRMARSYGVTEFLDLEEPGPQDVSDQAIFLTPAQTAACIEAIRACSDEGLPALVLGWKGPNGCRIGEYIYETILRIARNPFLVDIRPKLEDVTREAHRIHNIVAAQCARRQVAAFTSGHVSYTQWGITADLVLRNGGKTVWFDSSGNFSAYLLTRPPRDKETLSGLVRRIDQPLFQREFQQRGKLSEQFVSKVQHLFGSDYFLRPYWFEPTKSPPKPLVPLLREIALAKLGWPDAQCPVICVFMHCFSDLPRDDEQIYLDYYIWIVETLKIAVRDRSRKWIIKTHPTNRGIYDLTNATDRLKADYAQYDHIFFLDDELQKVEIFAVSDLAVTVRGSIAYEMSIFGKPALLAGHSILSDLGFCHVAKTAEEYETILKGDLASLALTAEMQQRAYFYLIYDKIICRLESTFMPYWTYRLTGDANIWNALSERILYNIKDMDPVVSAVEEMLDGGAPRTLNPRYRAFLNAAAPVEHKAPSSGPSLSWAAGARLSFERESQGIPLLLTKSVRSDDGGSWFAAGMEAYVGLVLTADSADAGSLGAQIGLGVAPANGVLHVAADNQPVRHIPLAGPGEGQPELVELGTALHSRHAPMVLRLWITDEKGARAEFRLDSLTIDTMQRLRPAKSRLRGMVSRLLGVGS